MSPRMWMLLKAAVLLGIGAAAGAGGGIAAWQKMNPPPKPRPVMTGSGPGSLAPPELPPEDDVGEPEPPVETVRPVDPSPPDPPVDTPPPPHLPRDPGPEFFGFPVGSTERAPVPEVVVPPPAVPAQPPSVDPKPVPPPPSLRRARFMKDRCVAGFDGVTTLHDFSGWTRAVTGEITWEKDNLAKTVRASATIDARTLDTGDADRDELMHKEHLESGKFPTMGFEVASIRLTGEDSMMMKGRMEIHGTQRDVEIPCTLKVRRDGYIFVKGEVATRMSDFGIVPPSKGGLINVKDEIRVWFEVWAEPVKEKPR